MLFCVVRLDQRWLSSCARGYVTTRLDLKTKSKTSRLPDRRRLGLVVAVFLADCKFSKVVLETF